VCAPCPPPSGKALPAPEGQQPQRKKQGKRDCTISPEAGGSPGMDPRGASARVVKRWRQGSAARSSVTHNGWPSYDYRPTRSTWLCRAE